MFRLCEREGCGHSPNVHHNLGDPDAEAAELFPCMIAGCGCVDMIRGVIRIEVESRS
jgi:hypothetical protein